jgi:hypothetical protein
VIGVLTSGYAFYRFTWVTDHNALAILLALPVGLIALFGWYSIAHTPPDYGPSAAALSARVVGTIGGIIVLLIALMVK